MAKVRSWDRMDPIQYINSNFIDIFISSCHVFIHSFIHSSNAENWVWYIGGRHLLYQSFFDTKLLMNKNEDTLHSTNNVGLTPFFIQFAKEKAKGNQMWYLYIPIISFGSLYRHIWEVPVWCALLLLVTFKF